MAFLCVQTTQDSGSSS